MRIHFSSANEQLISWNRYVESVAPLASKDELEYTKSAVKDFLSGAGPRLQQLVRGTHSLFLVLHCSKVVSEKQK
jgi:hypothetical protein